MKNNDLKNETTEKLQSDLKKIRAVVGPLIGIIIVLVSICIYGLITKENNSTFIALLAVGISVSSMIPVQYGKMKKIKTELAYRASLD